MQGQYACMRRPRVHLVYNSSVVRLFYSYNRQHIALPASVSLQVSCKIDNRAPIAMEPDNDYSSQKR